MHANGRHTKNAFENQVKLVLPDYFKHNFKAEKKKQRQLSVMSLVNTI